MLMMRYILGSRLFEFGVLLEHRVSEYDDKLETHRTPSPVDRMHGSGSTAQAQVRSTATVTLTVLLAPGMNFTQSGVTGVKDGGSSAFASQSESQITFSGTGNVRVKTDSRIPELGSVIHFRTSSEKRFTAADMIDVTEVQIVYPGS